MTKITYLDEIVNAILKAEKIWGKKATIIFTRNFLKNYAKAKEFKF